MKSAGVCHSDGYSHYHALLVSVSVLLLCGLLCLHSTYSLKLSLCYKYSRRGGWKTSYKWCDRWCRKTWMKVDFGFVYMCVLTTALNFLNIWRFRLCCCSYKSVKMFYWLQNLFLKVLWIESFYINLYECVHLIWIYSFKILYMLVYKIFLSLILWCKFILE